MKHFPPQDLAEKALWLVWKLMHVEGIAKPRKVPFYIDGGKRVGEQGSDEDRARLVTFREALRVFQESAGGYAGVGFCHQPEAGIIALDFDDCVVDGKIAQHVEDLCTGTYTEFSPSGTGIRAFFKGFLRSQKDTKGKRGPFPIEVFGHNGFVTFTGNVTETCELFGFENVVEYVTPAVLEMYRARGWDDTPVDVQPADADARALMMLEPTLVMTLGEMAEHLNKLSPDMGYEDWLHVGMAVHHQTGGSDEGFDVWHRWSMPASNYSSEDNCRERWVSFGRYHGGRVTTFKSVIAKANEADARNAFAEREAMVLKINECDNEFILRTRICPEIQRNAALDQVARSVLADALKGKLVGLGVKLSVAECKKLLAPVREEREGLDISERPEWLDGWVWVGDRNEFYHCGRGRFSSTTDFNAQYNRYMPRADGAAMTVLKNASAMALEDYQITTVARSMYLPWANAEGEGVFQFEGADCVNTYRTASVPTAVDVMDEKGHEAVRIVMRHINLVTGGREEITTHLVDWLAYNVQKPGVKIRHTPLIKGIEGDGKSLLGNLLAQVMGTANVKQISPKVLGTDFSDWAHGACVAILEEIRLAGHNRHDNMNSLKPMITNDLIAVHPKGKAEVNVINTQNYLAFTNHNDALPLSDTDRRWMIVFTPWTTTEHLVEHLSAMGYTLKEYFDEVHAAIASQFAQLRRWLLAHRISPSFNPNGAAPMTPEKAAMQRAAASPEEELVREIIATGAAGVGQDVLSATCLLDAAQLADTDVSLQTTVLNRVLSKLGWSKVEKRVKWQQRAHRVWTRHAGFRADWQDELDKTLQKNAGIESVPAEATIGFTDVSNLF